MRQHRTHVLEEVEQAFRELVRADSRRLAQRCYHQPVSLTAVLFHFFFTEAAESEFRAQPAATAVSASGGVDTTLTCTRADVHFLVRTLQCTVHTLIRIFPMLSHWHWLKVKGICVAHFSQTIFIWLSCLC